QHAATLFVLSVTEYIYIYSIYTKGPATGFSIDSSISHQSQHKCKQTSFYKGSNHRTSRLGIETKTFCPVLCELRNFGRTLIFIHLDLKFSISCYSTRMVKQNQSCLLYVTLGVLLFQTATALTCYHCSNFKQEACGGNFQSYLFDGFQCDSMSTKCALQKNSPVEGGWIGFIRGCYTRGMLPGIDDNNGCRLWTVNNMTALYCFCETDFCNGTPSNQSLSIFPIMIVFIVFIYNILFGLFHQ
ncbi:hypothetical protein Ahia01_000463200, partial [Argonauta hians]